jgi:hypothetical protein
VIGALLVASWVWGLAGLGVLALIGLGIYSAFQLRDEDAWTERQPKKKE